MADNSTVDELTINYEDNGIETVKELDSTHRPVPTVKELDSAKTCSPPNRAIPCTPHPVVLRPGCRQRHFR